jgi:hypothetical protein
MYKKRFHLVIFSLALLMFQQKSIANTDVKAMLLIHKTPTCGCCKEWVKHAKDNGFNVHTQDHKNLEDIKKMYAIQPKYRSCHTTVSSNGFIFEGHIPVKYITQFLSEDHPNAIGLSVPGMPLGSPGMEFDDKFTPYNILILFNDGSNEVYAEILKK